jgi:hypothetical protein
MQNALTSRKTALAKTAWDALTPLVQATCQQHQPHDQRRSA